MLQNTQNERRNTAIHNYNWRLQHAFTEKIYKLIFVYQYNTKYVARMELNDIINQFDLIDISGTFQQYKIHILFKYSWYNHQNDFIFGQNPPTLNKLKILKLY